MSSRGRLAQCAVVVVSLASGTAVNGMLGVTYATMFTLGLVGGLVTLVVYAVLRLAMIGRAR